MHVAGLRAVADTISRLPHLPRTAKLIHPPGDVTVGVPSAFCMAATEALYEGADGEQRVCCCVAGLSAWESAGADLHDYDLVTIARLYLDLDVDQADALFCPWLPPSERVSSELRGRWREITPAQAVHVLRSLADLAVPGAANPITPERITRLWSESTKLAAEPAGQA